ncbi:hypothetical protein [Salinactinospora qingdaonensis]|uniref:Septum formation initiator n=1 Tax=Salinactinospora qingdaonensis TaxID=702744 RepID=A0ABP7FLR9_9ACTN
MSSATEPEVSKPANRSAPRATPRRSTAGSRLRTSASAPQRPGVRAAARRPRATPVPNAPRMPFVLLILGLLGGALVSLLVLRTVLTEDAYALAQLQRQTEEMNHREEELREKVLYAESPQTLAERAEELGMVPGDSAEFINVETGEIVGAPAGDAGAVE